MRFFRWLRDRMRQEVNCAKSHQRLISEALLSGQPPFQTGNTYLSQALLPSLQQPKPKLTNRNAQERWKWALATLVWSLNPWISCGWSIRSKGPRPTSFQVVFTASLPNDWKTYLLCIVSPGDSVAVKKSWNFPVFRKIIKNRHHFCIDLFNYYEEMTSLGDFQTTGKFLEVFVYS